MSMKNGPGCGLGPVRSNRTRPATAPGLTVKSSPTEPPLTSTVSLPSPPSLRSSPWPGFQIIRSSPAPPRMSSVVPAGFRPAVIVSSPPLAFMSSVSVVPISMKNGPGCGLGPVRSKRTLPGIVDGLTVNCSPTLPPLTTVVSLPSPPSLRSSPWPGFQVIVSSPAPPRASSVVLAGLRPGTMLSLPSSPSIVSAKSLPVIVSLPPLPCTLTVGAGDCVKSVVVTPARLIVFAPGPPRTTSDVRSAQLTPAGVLFHCTTPAAQVTVIASSASLARVRSVPASVGVTVALAMPGNASAAAAAAAASRAARGVKTRSSRATSASSSRSRGLPEGRRRGARYSASTRSGDVPVEDRAFARCAAGVTGVASPCHQ
jgi:hypothetical protein